MGRVARVTNIDTRKATLTTDAWSARKAKYPTMHVYGRLRADCGVTPDLSTCDLTCELLRKPVTTVPDL